MLVNEFQEKQNDNICEMLLLGMHIHVQTYFQAETIRNRLYTQKMPNNIGKILMKLQDIKESNSADMQFKTIKNL